MFSPYRMKLNAFWEWSVYKSERHREPKMIAHFSMTIHFWLKCWPSIFRAIHFPGRLFSVSPIFEPPRISWTSIFWTAQLLRPPIFETIQFRRTELNKWFKDILFKFWHPSTPAQFYLSCLSVLVIGLVYELLKACQLKFIQRYSFRPADHMCLGKFFLHKFRLRLWNLTVMHQNESKMSKMILWPGICGSIWETCSVNYKFSDMIWTDFLWHTFRT